MADYNGWKNYETWAVALWFDNDYRMQRMYQDWAAYVWHQAKADETFTREERAKLDLADRVKKYVEDKNPLAASMYADLLGAALSEVDYYEIAENWLEDVEK